MTYREYVARNLGGGAIGAGIGAYRGYHGNNPIHHGDRKRGALHGAFRGAGQGMAWLGAVHTQFLIPEIAAKVIGGEAAGHYAAKIYDHHQKRARLDSMSPIKK
jgi:hypothetical protein